MKHDLTFLIAAAAFAASVAVPALAQGGGGDMMSGGMMRHRPEIDHDGTKGGDTGRGGMMGGGMNSCGPMMQGMANGHNARPNEQWRRPSAPSEHG